MHYFFIFQKISDLKCIVKAEDFEIIESINNETISNGKPFKLIRVLFKNWEIVKINPNHEDILFDDEYFDGYSLTFTLETEREENPDILTSYTEEEYNKNKNEIELYFELSE